MGETDYTVRTSTFTAGFSRQNMLGTDPRRVGLLFSGSGGIMTATVIAAAWGSIEPRFPVPTTGYVEFLYAKHGPLVAGAWDLLAGAGEVVFVTEILLSAGR